MEAIIVFLIEVLVAYLYLVSPDNVSGGFPYQIEFLVSCSAALLSMFMSFSCYFFKKHVIMAKLIKTVVFISIWIPFRIWMLNLGESFDYRVLFNMGDLYWICNITIPETLVLIYYIFRIVKDRK